MCENSEDLQIKLARKYLKMKIMENSLTFRGHESQKSHVYDLISRTVEAGESNSALIIGPRGSGKTTLIDSVIWELDQKPEFAVNSIIVNLNGLLHTDDKLALKTITTQMSLDNAIGDKVFGSFAENLAFLLQCLKSGQDKHCKSVIFILEEFDMFCHTHGSQTLLYNLFDIAQSRQAPICVIGVTCRLDVIELLEKRVKSRFSHRQIFIFPNSDSSSENGNTLTPFDKRMELFTELLSLPCEVKKPKKLQTLKLSLGNLIRDINLSDSESFVNESFSGKDSGRRRSRLDNSLSEFLILNKTSRKNTTDSIYSKGANSRKSSISNLNANKNQNISSTKDESPSKMDVDNQNDSDVLNTYEIPHDILVKCETDWREFCLLDPIFVSFWNENIKELANDEEIRTVLERMFDIDVNEQSFRNILTQLVCKLSVGHPQLEKSDVLQVCQNILNVDDKVLILLSLSILELSLIIAMKHQTEIFDSQPMNFEMVLNRYTKFASSNSSSQSVPRAVVLKAFEHLKSMELMVPVRSDGGFSSGRVQKEYQLYRLLITSNQVAQVVKQYKALPTEISQWATSSLV